MALAERFGWHPLDVEDVLSKRQPEGGRVRRLPLHRSPLRSTDKSVQRLNAGELDAFLGPDYLVTLPKVGLLPVTRLFRLRRRRGVARQPLRQGSGCLLYHVLDDLFDYCFPILDKIGHKLDRIEDDIGEDKFEDIVRDISKTAESSRTADHQAAAPDPAAARASRRAVPARGARALLRRPRGRLGADLGPARQLQGGRGGAGGDERGRDRTSLERRPARAHRHHRLLPLTLIAKRVRDERRVPRARDGDRVLGDRRQHGRRAGRVAGVHFRLKRFLQAALLDLGRATPVPARHPVQAVASFAAVQLVTPGSASMVSLPAPPKIRFGWRSPISSSPRMPPITPSISGFGRCPRRSAPGGEIDPESATRRAVVRDVDPTAARHRSLPRIAQDVVPARPASTSLPPRPTRGSGRNCP